MEQQVYTAVETTELGEKLVAVDAQKVGRVVERVESLDLGVAEMAAVCAELMATIGRAEGATMTVLALGLWPDGRRATARLSAVDAGPDPVAVVAAVQMLVEAARPELWREIHEVLIAPPALLAEWLRAAAKA